ncbi:MAG: phosphodiester glycosidase family protein [Chthoniobacterales bacterium]
MRHLIFAGVLCGLVAVTARADWAVVRTMRVNSPNELVEHRQAEVENAETGEHATVHLAVFKTKTATWRVVDQPSTPRADLAEAMTATQALAGVNGGYFDPEDAPVGLLVNAGKKVTPQSSARLLSGVLFATPKRVDIVRAKRFRLSAEIREAVQCGPLLLDAGKPVPGLNDTRVARRTFAAVSANGATAALGYCSSVSLAQLGKILGLEKMAGAANFTRALNLDGGSSSAFWVAQGNDAFSISELKTVRDFVAILPRTRSSRAER